MLEKQLLERIEARFGKPIRYPEETVALSQAIFDSTREYLSASTLKRMFGWLSGSASHRKSTLDILAVYLGFDSYAALKDDISKDVSTPSEKSSPLRISVGDVITFSSASGWSMTLKYEGDEVFRVVSEMPGMADIGDELIIRDVG